MSKPWPDKDPNDVLDFGFDWKPLFSDEDDIITITTATVIEGGVIVDRHGALASSQETVTWLSGGIVGPASVRLRATTAEGRTADQTMTLMIAER